MPSTPDIRIAENGDGWSQAAAAVIYTASETLIDTTGRCLIALSGGSTPKTLYQALAGDTWRQQFRWADMLFLFGDERCVPPDHPESNFAMAQTALFDPIHIPHEQVYRMKGEADVPGDAAGEYETTLRQLTHTPPPSLPPIDLIILGLGEDGHTASLFPGSPALHDSFRAVMVTQSPKGIRERLTLTLGVINRATVVVFLVTGSGKAPMVRAILEPENAAERELPAAQVAPGSGQLIWMLDQAAAGHLTRHD